MSIFDDIGGAIGGIVGGLTGGMLGPTPQANANLIAPVTAGQVTDQYGNVQSGLMQQQALIDAMKNAGTGGVYSSQVGLMNQLQQQSQGQGPNPAQAQLAQATGDASQRQAALMAGQRGTGGNAGMMARQIGMQGANQQQQMVGQAATLQAQQQLAAQQQLGQQQAQLAGQNAGATGMYNQAAQGAYGQVLGGIGGQNANQLQLAGMNAGLQGQRAGQQAGLIGGLIGAGGAAMMGKPPTPAMAYGGTVPAYNHGGPISKAGMHFHNMKSGGHVPGSPKIGGDSPKNDTQPAMLSPGEIVIPRSIATGKDAPAKAAAFVRACLAKGRR